jgi:UDP:flavonoid glycosyltransferase YjiC (YdhE family)
MLGAFGHGLPQLLVPQGADNFVNAERAVGAGAARRLLPEELQPTAVAADLRLLLGDPGYRAGAERIAAQIAAMPAPAEVAAELRATCAADRR